MASARTDGLRGDNNSPAPAKLFPQWREVEQDFWLDMFQSYSETLLNQIPEDEKELGQAIEQAGSKEQYYTERIKLAAVLADEATKELIYRFERQKPLPKQRRASGGSGGDETKKKRRTIW